MSEARARSRTKTVLHFLYPALVSPDPLAPPAAGWSGGARVGCRMRVRMRRWIPTRQERPISLNPGWWEKLAEVFAAWSDLQPAEKHDLLHSLQIRIRVSRSRRRVLKVEQVAVGLLESPDNEGLYN